MSLTLQFASTKNEINEQLGVLRKNNASMESALPSFLEESRLRESGLVIVVNYPNEDPVSDMGEHLYNRFIAFPPLGKVFTTQFALGFRLDEEHYVTLSGAAYEARQGEVFAAATNAGRVVLDATETPVVGHGIEVRIDVNDKPRFDSTEILGRRDISFILDKSTDMIVNDLDKMMGFV